MRVPNADAARVDLEKVTEYLLSETHPVGNAKARFFKGLGFSETRPGELVWALLGIVRNRDAHQEIPTAFGTKYVVDGNVTGRMGTGAIRTVWLIERDAPEPRLVTAYPRPKEKQDEGT